MFQQPLIEDLALISDRNTCAVLDKKGAIQWYCPDRFDGKAVLSGLVDNNGGYWTVSQWNVDFVDRAYLNSSSILRQNFKLQDHEFYIDDWMPMNRDYAGIVRQFSTSPVAQHNVLKVKGDDGAAEGKVTLLSAKAAFFEKEELYLYCSHTIYGDNPGEVSFTIPEGQDGWAYLSSYQHNEIPDFAALKEETLAKWEEFLSVFEYTGLYQSDVKDSLRAILQLTCGKTGGILAAATTSLPEVIGGERNYDYRYVWVRDAALITAALSVLETDGELEFGFLEFMYQAMKKNTGQCVYPLYTIDYQMIDHLEQLEATGYLESRPVQVGNIASEQRQLDAEANVLISGYIIYDKYGKRLHWKTMRKIANFICENWHKPENGIWEEGLELQYTAGKVYSALGLEMMSRFNEDEKEAAYWKEVAKEIRDYVSNNCMTPDGAFANYAGSDETDISSVLYVIFGYVEANAPEMLATIKLLEDHYQENNLYRRTLVEFDSAKEGAFLAGSCWMAHYYAVAGNFEKSRQILDAVKACQNDLGFFSEEADPLTGRMLGNFDQTFVHSSFICAANGLTREIEGTSTVVRVP